MYFKLKGKKKSNIRTESAQVMFLKYVHTEKLWAATGSLWRVPFI